MPNSTHALESILAIDVGNIYTRVIFFEVVDGQYRPIASGLTRSTAQFPYNDIGLGVREAINEIVKITGRDLFDSKNILITPTNQKGKGVDKVVATLSAGPPISIITVGLIDEISSAYVINLALTVYSNIQDNFWLHDHKQLDERISCIHRVQPDMIIIGGGTDSGAVKPILKLVQAVGLANNLQFENKRPEILFVGNQDIHREIENLFGDMRNIHLCPNIHPANGLDRTIQGHPPLAKIFCNIKAKQMHGVDELDSWTQGKLIPTSMALGYLVRSLSKVYGSRRGVLGIDIGTSSTTVALALHGSLNLKVYTEFGFRITPNNNNEEFLKEITNWLRFEASISDVRDYLYNKILYPGSIASTKMEIDIELAIVRQIIRNAIIKFFQQLQQSNDRISNGSIPITEPIIVTGSILNYPGNLALTTLTLLDAIQPVGITTLVLDQDKLVPALGASLLTDPLIAIQSIDSGALHNLGVVISPSGNFRYGTPILHVRIVYEDDSEKELLVKMGDIETLPLSPGKTGVLHLQPLHRSDIGMGAPGRGGNMRINGSLQGVIIDGRGRPIKINKDASIRREWNKRWLNKLTTRR